MENKKTIAKNQYQANKVKLQKRLRDCHRSLYENEKIKKDIKICWQQIHKEKIKYEKIITIKEKIYWII